MSTKTVFFKSAAAFIAALLLIASVGCVSSARPGESSAQAPTEAPAEAQTEAPAEVPTEAPSEAPSPDPIHMIESPDTDTRDAAKAIQMGLMSMEPIPEDQPLEDIPVYYEEDLLYKLNYIGKDTSEYSVLSSMPDSVGAVLSQFPGAAIRKSADGRAYMVYDTETGYRLFLPLAQKIMGIDYGYQALIGYPVVVGRVLSHSDFEGLSVGDPIDAVSAVDPVAGVYKKLAGVYGLDAAVTESNKENGRPFSSMHYLTDGILKIEYAVDDDMNVVIDNMVYSPDRVIDNYLGDPVDYRINEVDLP